MKFVVIWISVSVGTGGFEGMMDTLGSVLLLIEKYEDRVCTPESSVRGN